MTTKCKCERCIAAKGLVDVDEWLDAVCPEGIRLYMEAASAIATQSAREVLAKRMNRSA